MPRYLWGGALIILLISLVCGCGVSKRSSKTTNTIVRGKLLVGSDVTYPPFEFLDDKRPTGFDVDLGKEIAKRLDLKLQIIDTPFERLIPDLIARRFDVIISATSITPETESRIYFSVPYMRCDQAICVRKKSPIRYESDLKGKTVGVLMNSTGKRVAEEIKERGIPVKFIRVYDYILFAFEDLEFKRIDAIITDFPVIAYLSKKRGKTRVTKRIDTGERYAVGVRREDGELLGLINSALEGIRNDGSYRKICMKWFGTADF
ncbi:MAG: ABC transporter substrate-binding protein [Actinomycetota bacterium]|nr:ABC transporter substrate-binding protein [Actinomycetota bacterium]